MNTNLKDIIAFSVIILVTIIVATIIKRIFQKFINRSSGVLVNDPTNYQFLKHFLTAIIYVVGFSIAIYRLPELRTLASSLLAGAGILAVIVGFASQQALGNVVSGFFIILFKPFRVNDRLIIRDTLNGVVEDITLRHTVIRDFNNRRIIIPNTLINQEIIVNADFNDESICRWVEIGISYDSDIDRARAIMIDEALRHPLHIDWRTPEDIAKGKQEVFVRVIALGEYSVNLRCYVWAKNNADAFILGCDLLESIKKRFDAEGIEIPFPYRTLVYKHLMNGTPAEQQTIIEPNVDKNH